MSGSLAALRNQMLGHGEAYRVIHALQSEAQVGIRQQHLHC